GNAVVRQLLKVGPIHRASRLASPAFVHSSGAVSQRPAGRPRADPLLGPDSAADKRAHRRPAASCGGCAPLCLLPWVGILRPRHSDGGDELSMRAGGAADVAGAVAARRLLPDDHDRTGGMAADLVRGPPEAQTRDGVVLAAHNK